MSFDKTPRRPYGRLLFACGLSLLTLLFMRLGYWQLDRAEQSRELTRTVQQRAALPPLAPGDLSNASDELKYRRVILEGRFEPERQIFIQGRKQDGMPGYHHVVPFRLKGSDMRVLVNRGWVEERDAAPDAPGHRIRGIVAAPQVPPLRMGAADAAGPWPYLDLQRYRRATGHRVHPFIVIEDGRLAEETLTRGLERADRWGMHIGYAIQWFVFALLAGILFFIVLRTGRKDKNESA